MGDQGSATVFAARTSKLRRRGSLGRLGLSILLLSISLQAAQADTVELKLASGAKASTAFALFVPAATQEASSSGVVAKLDTTLPGSVFPRDREIQLVDLPAKLRKDLRTLMLAPTQWRGREWKQFGLGVVLVLASSALDEPVQSAVNRVSSREVDRLAETLRPLGEEAGLALFAGAWVLGRATHRPQWVALGQDGLEASLIASGLLAPALKSISGRPRPRESQTTEARFDLFGGGQSFPSGEAAQAFALASVLASYSSSRWVQTAAYGMAGLLAVHRITADAHWTSDVVAGALIGTAVGRWVVRQRESTSGPDRAGLLKTWEIGPATGPTGSGYGLLVRLAF